MSMYVYHGTWSQADACFFLWGEDAYRFTQKRRQGATATIPKHPFQMKLPELDRLLNWADPLDRRLLLPSVPDDGPIPSPELLVDAPNRWFDPAVVAPAPWTVTGLALRPADALTFLASLPCSGEVSPELSTRDSGREDTFGSDLRCWSQVARLGLELLVRERFVPAVSAERNVACWELLLDAPEDQSRLAALASSLPPVASALLPRRTSPDLHRPPVASELIRDFLLTTADGQLRHWLAGAFADARARLWLSRVPATVRRWAESLTEERPGALASHDSFALEGVIANWTAPAFGSAEPGPAPTPFRTCFRLEPPAPGGEDDLWLLRVLLQAEDDLTLLIPAATVWSEGGNMLNALGRRFVRPQERLLSDLGRAARLYPRLAEALRTPRPEECPLSVGDAYRFLTEGAWVFSQNGLGVLLPVELKDPAKARARAHVKAPANASAAGLGLAQLLEVDWAVMLGDQPVSVDELKQLAKLKAPLVQFRGQWVELDPERISALLSQIERRAGRISVGEALRLSTGDLAPLGGAEIAELQTDAAVGSLLQRLVGNERFAELEPPASLCGQLRPYQARGFSWLAFLRTYGIGACLADDMGLGKTIQMIALLLHERAAGQTIGPTLLICPTSLVGNWQRELARFGPSLRVLVHHGAGRRRGDDFTGGARSVDVVISTYALSHRDLADLGKVDWAGIVLDEAQNIKNADTRQSKSLRSLAAGYRIALTGTPVENRLAELWSLMDFLNPGYLGTATEFQTRFALPIERHGDEVAAARLRRHVAPFILRRVKTDPDVIGDLPEKQELPVFINLTPEQASLYGAVVEQMMERIAKTDGLQRRGLVLATLTRLKQICNHPAQFLADGSQLAGRSGKLNRLMEMLEEVLAEGERALIFTQYAQMGYLLQRHLSGALGREVLFLHGAVAGRDRAGLVERFQSESGPPLFVLTLKAGGVGLNLTRANHVFHFDRWWNPAVESQATDRAYRIGQERNVLVHKLIAAGTVEEKIDALIAGKRQLADRVVGAGEGWLTELGTDELRALFALDRE